MSTLPAPTARQVFSLSQVGESIGRTLAQRYGSCFWIKAEMNKLGRYHRSGHCYPELVEKQDGRTIAQMRCTLWKPDFERINRQFIAMLGEGLKDGITILFSARVCFDPNYGLSLHIEDIDPSFTLGALEAEKAAAIRRLQQEGLYELNKTKVLPMLPQRLAIISIETSKGLLDFNSKIQNNAAGYAIHTMLFPSLLQGDGAVPSLLTQLARIARVAHYFDAVAIIRGGGGDVGLTCYNNYELCAAIARFPIPVLTGIGHVTNETVAEKVSARSFITPTDLAMMLLQCFQDAAMPVAAATARLRQIPAQELYGWQSTLQRMAERCITATRTGARAAHHALGRSALQFKAAAEKKLLAAMHETKEITLHLTDETRCRLAAAQEATGKKAIRLIQKDVRHCLKESTTTLRHLENTVQLLHPNHVLRRGFSITRLHGKALTNAAAVKPGDVIETELYNGAVGSTVLNQAPLVPNETGYL